MRIRKRHALVVEPRQRTRSPSGLSAVKDGGEHLVGQPDNCTCCSRLRRLENGELGNAFERRESGEPSNRFASGTLALADKNEVSQRRYLRAETPPSDGQKFRGRSGSTPPEDCYNSEFIDAEEKESNAATTMELLRGVDRVRNTQQNIKANGTREYNNGLQLHDSEGDVNHPGNKPKESLLYSLYCVFSKLSGKAVLTAREALSRIIEEHLPGLNEETGLPSVQVAKVMRSNPYFVHLEGGKFFLCSAPSSSDSKEYGPDSPEDLVDSEQPPRSTSPVFQSSKIIARNSFSKAESSKAKQQQQQHQQQPFSTIEAIRTKRLRSKEVAIITVDGTVGKTKCRSSGSQREGQQKALKVQNISEQGGYVAEPVEHICKRYDGRGWKCHEIALPGYSMCRHHHELIVNRLARLRSSGNLGSKKSSKRRKNSAKPLKEVPAMTSEGEISVNKEQNETSWFKNIKARSLKSINN